MNTLMPTGVFGKLDVKEQESNILLWYSLGMSRRQIAEGVGMHYNSIKNIEKKFKSNNGQDSLQFDDRLDEIMLDEDEENNDIVIGEVLEEEIVENNTVNNIELDLIFNAKGSNVKITLENFINMLEQEKNYKIQFSISSIEEQKNFI